MLKTKLDIKLLTTFHDFTHVEFATSYNHFLSFLGGIFEFFFSAEHMLKMRPLYEQRGETPFFICIFSENKMVAFLPMQVQEIGVKPLQFKRLRLWGRSGHYNSNHHSGFMCLSEYEKEASAVTLDFLRAEFNAKFDEIILTRVKKEGPFLNHLDAYFDSVEYRSNEEKDHIYRSSTPLENRIKGETRRKIRKASESLAAAFEDVSYQLHQQINMSLFESLATLHIQRQRELIESGRKRMSFFEDPIEKQTFLNQLQYAQDKNALRIYTLHLNNELICFLVCFNLNGYTDAILTAFKELSEHRYMPRCLWYYAFDQELNQLSTRVIDMGYGTHTLKSTFSTEALPLENIRIKNQRKISSKIKNFLLQVKMRLKI